MEKYIGYGASKLKKPCVFKPENPKIFWGENPPDPLLRTPLALVASGWSRMNVSEPAPRLELPLRSTASSTVSALLTVRLRVSPLHALPLFLQVTEQTTDMSSGLLTTDSGWCAIPPAAASPQCDVDDRHALRFELPSLHILHVRCQFCVIHAVGRNLQFLHV